MATQYGRYQYHRANPEHEQGCRDRCFLQATSAADADRVHPCIMFLRVVHLYLFGLFFRGFAEAFCIKKLTLPQEDCLKKITLFLVRYPQLITLFTRLITLIKPNSIFEVCLASMFA